MALRDEIMAQARQYPEVGQIVDQIESQLGDAQINPGELTQAIKALEHVLQVPEDYPKIRAAAIMEDMIDPEMLPAQFDIRIVLAILIALYELQDRLAGRQQQVPQDGPMPGGLAAMAAAGRGGDSELVHVNPREKEMLERVGGQGSVNPNTGLREYKGGFFKSFMKVLIPAVSILVPGIGTAIGGALGFGGLGASIVGGAALGAAGSAVTGGNVLQGAALGGLGGGLGNVVGGATNKALGLGLGEKTANVLGSGLVGAGVGAATGQGALKGAGMGVLGGAIGEIAGGAISPNSALKSGALSAAQSVGHGLAAGYDPKQAGLMGVTSGLIGGLSYKPSTDALSKLQVAKSEAPGLNYEGGEAIAGAPGDVSVGYKASQMPGTSADSGSVSPVVYRNGVPMNAAGQTAYDSAGNQWVTVQNPNTGVTDFMQVPANAQYNPATGTIQQGTWSTQGDQAVFTPSQPADNRSFLQKAFGAEPTQPGLYDQMSGGQAAAAPGQAAASKGILGTGISTGGLLGLGTLGYSLLSGSDVPTQSMPELSEAQKEYMNLPTLTWDWSQLQKDAAASGQSLGAYVSNNWNTVQGGKYNTVAAAKGGALRQIAGYARGAGTGRSDSIDAKLSDGEYVIDAETVSLLGDGSNEAGARMLDQMRGQIRKQKGKALAKGKISPNAKNPLAYIKEMA